MNKFPKIEKLCGQIRIQQLYSKGKKFTCWPLRIIYLHTDSSIDNPQVLIWAPKSLFKHAVDRNHVKRMIREVYRLHNEPVKNRQLHIAFIYMDKEIQSFATIEKAMIKALTKITDYETDCQTNIP